MPRPSFAPVSPQLSAPVPTSDTDQQQVLVFDLFGVIADVQDPAGQRHLEELAGVSTATEDSREDSRRNFWDAYWSRRPGYDRGEITGQQYWTELGRDLGLPITSVLAARLIDADVQSWSRIDQSMVNLLRGLHANGRRLALLSNAPHEIAAAMRAQHAWLEIFTAVVFSCEVGAAKPAPAAYEAVEAAIGPTGPGFLMIDDRRENVTAAHEHGWAGTHFSGPVSLTASLHDETP